jgi:hypothetical protein
MTPTPPRHRAARPGGAAAERLGADQGPLQLRVQLVGKVRLVAATARRNRW